MTEKNTKNIFSEEINRKWEEVDKKCTILFQNIKKNKDRIRELCQKNKDIDYEEGIYRFYHGSFKVFRLQNNRDEMFRLIEALKPFPHDNLHEWFVQIIEEANEIGNFKMEYNKNFPKHTRPIIEAHLHCKYFIDMMEKCLDLETEPKPIVPFEWGALLELYCII